MFPSGGAVCGAKPTGDTQGHDFRRRAVVPSQPGHAAHGRSHVAEEALVGGAELVQTRLAVGCADESILEILAIAGETDVANQANVIEGE